MCKKNFYDDEWKKNPNAVLVSRPTKYGNPFKMNDESERDAVIELYREWLIMVLEEDPHFLDELKGKDLVCFCSLDKKCHADVLIEFITGQESSVACAFPNCKFRKEECNDVRNKPLKCSFNYNYRKTKPLLTTPLISFNDGNK